MKSKFLITMAATGLLAAGSSQAAVLLSSDFTGVVASDTSAPYTATNITWTTSGLTLASNDLTFTGYNNGTGNGFITAGSAANNIQVNRNVETGGPWSTSFTVTPTATLDLTNFTLFYRAISGTGVNQSAVKNGIATMRVYLGTDNGGTLLGTFSDTFEDPGGGTAAGDTADIDLSSLDALSIGQAYHFELTTSAHTSTLGNNWAIDDLTLNGVPEPSAALLGGLGLLVLLRRRR
jgi:hypothetical protein